MKGKVLLASLINTMNPSA